MSIKPKMKPFTDEERDRLQELISGPDIQRIIRTVIGKAKKRYNLRDTSEIENEINWSIFLGARRFRPERGSRFESALYLWIVGGARRAINRVVVREIREGGNQEMLYQNPAPEPEEPNDELIMQRRLMDGAAHNMEPALRQVFELMREGLGIRRIAPVLGISFHATKTLYGRVKEHLWERLGFRLVDGKQVIYRPSGKPASSTPSAELIAPRQKRATVAPPKEAKPPRQADLVFADEMMKTLDATRAALEGRIKKGIVPRPKKYRHWIVWDRSEIEAWIRAGQPTAAEWEAMKTAPQVEGEPTAPTLPPPPEPEPSQALEPQAGPLGLGPCSPPFPSPPPVDHARAMARGWHFIRFGRSKGYHLPRISFPTLV